MSKAKARLKYPIEKSGAWIRPVMKNYRLKCCDCGLVHVIDFKVICWGKGHKVKFRAFRCHRSNGRKMKP